MAAELLTIEDVSRRLKVKPKTLSNWRSSGTGPRFMRLCGRILYPFGRLLEWEEQRALRRGAEHGKKGVRRAR